jgi:hypothetical protein
MNDLEKYFRNNTGNLINKWTHYFNIYDRHFSRYRASDVHVLEIGVRHGGSLQMWKDYFGPAAKIYGVDVHPRSRELEEEQIEIFVGDQEDRGFLAELREQLPRVDIVIDDGGHTMVQQITTFKELFMHVADDGIYVCEDTHTSYWSTFGGGFRKPDTFIEYSKGLVDDLHAWHNREDSEGLEVTEFTRRIDSLHFYDSMVVIEKGEHPRPAIEHTGKQRLPRFKATPLPKEKPA